MLNHSKHLFAHKKTTHKKLFFLCATILCLSTIYFAAHSYLQQKISIILNEQQSLFQKQNFNFKFQTATNPSWKIWPQLTLTYPTLQKNDLNSAPQIIWQAKQAKIHYSLWHPLSILIDIDGNQLFCPNQTSASCLQIHGTSWNIHIPLLGNNASKVITLQCAETFYTNNTQITGSIQSLQLTKIQADFHWNDLAKINEALAFSTLNIQKALINLATFPPQKLKNIKIKATLIRKQDTQNLSNIFYKLLLQQAEFSWNNLSANTSGKLYVSFPEIIPTGELSVHLKGIDQTIYQQLIPLTCCQKLKEELAQTPLPSQLNFTILVREGAYYLGAIPLESSWYNTFQTLIKTYTK